MAAKRRRRQRPDPLATTNRVRTSGRDHRHRQPHRERRGRLRHRHPTGRRLSGAQIPKRLPRRQRELPLQGLPHSRWPNPHHKQLRRPVDPVRELVASRPSFRHPPFYYHPSRPIPPRHQPQRTVELEPTYCIQFVMRSLRGQRSRPAAQRRRGRRPRPVRARVRRSRRARAHALRSRRETRGRTRRRPHPGAERIDAFFTPRPDALQPDAVLAAVAWIGDMGFWLGGESPPAHPLIGSGKHVVTNPGAGGNIASADLEAGLSVAFCHHDVDAAAHSAARGMGHPLRPIVDAIREVVAERVPASPE
jgi:hypothetical protein